VARRCSRHGIICGGGDFATGVTRSTNTGVYLRSVDLVRPGARRAILKMSPQQKPAKPLTRTLKLKMKATICEQRADYLVTERVRVCKCVNDPDVPVTVMA